MNKTKTAISIDHNLLEETINIARELDIPRSQLVSLALEEYVLRYRNQQLLHQINEANSEPSDEDETGSLEIIRSHQKKYGEPEEWK